MKKRLGILTDSHSSIDPAAAEKLGVRVLPMPFTIDGETFLENVTLSREHFFQRQSEGAEISISQPAPGDLLAFWDEALENYEQALYFPLSSGLSGSCQTAQMLAQEEPYAGRILVVDNGRIATPQYQAILDAITLMEQGHGAEEIHAALEAHKSEMVIYLGVQTLEYLKRGGRLSPTAATVGTLLNIKPILKLSTGKLESYKNCRGFIKAKAAMLESIRSDLTIRFREAHARGDVRLLAATAATPEDTDKWLREIEAAFPGMPVLHAPLSLGVSCHTGLGALGVGLSVTPHINTEA